VTLAPGLLALAAKQLVASAFTWTYRVPRLPSFVSSLYGLGYPDQMTLVQRLTTLIFEGLLLLQFQNATTTYVARLAPDRSAISPYQLTEQV